MTFIRKQREVGREREMRARFLQIDLLLGTLQKIIRFPLLIREKSKSTAVTAFIAAI